MKLLAQDTKLLFSILNWADCFSPSNYECSSYKRNCHFDRVKDNLSAKSVQP